MTSIKIILAASISSLICQSSFGRNTNIPVVHGDTVEVKNITFAKDDQNPELLNVMATISYTFTTGIKAENFVVEDDVNREFLNNDKFKDTHNFHINLVNEDINKPLSNGGARLTGGMGREKQEVILGQIKNGDAVIVNGKTVR